MSATDSERIRGAGGRPAGGRVRDVRALRAPVESTQRYCVVCGTRRKHVHDPAARFLADATALARAERPGPAASPRRSSGLGLALPWRRYRSRSRPGCSSGVPAAGRQQAAGGVARAEADRGERGGGATGRRTAARRPPRPPPLRRRPG